MSVSALYEGRVRHRRYEPVEHEFTYPVFMAYLDLDELPGVLDPVSLWSARRPAPARFKRSDHLGNPERPLAECVRETVSEQIGERPRGPIRTLTNLRYLGHCFNPVSFHFCFDPSETRLDAVLADVSNTWGDRHSYVLGGDGGKILTGQVTKEFPVSPLMGMEQSYLWRATTPGERTQVHIESRRGAALTFDATLSLERRELDSANARRMLARYPAMTAQIVARIYWQALRLRLKGAPWFGRPESA